MKQIVQNYNKGTLSIEKVPEPLLKSGGVLVQSFHSLISAGTEKMKIDDSKRSYLGMAKARPEKVKQVLETLKQQGPIATYRKVMNRLDSFTPLGYSLAGQVIGVGNGVTEFKMGDMVACAGADIATHAEINWIPVNLCCKIPKYSAGMKNEDQYVPTKYAAFTTVGAIAMQGVRQAKVHVGENVAVIGLGLVGLLSCLILKAAGCNVLGIDLDPLKTELALKLGIDMAGSIGKVDIEQSALSFTGGLGVDAVIVTTGTKSNEPIIMAGNIARDRGTIVNVGINKMDIPWDLYFAKELVLKQSRSYGPGRYDPEYELKGKDYPVGYVRWTEKRNMESFLNLIAGGKIDVARLITHEFPLEDAQKAYDIIEGNASELYVGMILAYNVDQETLQKARFKTLDLLETPKLSSVNLGLIGAGNFARTMLLPYLKTNKDVNLISVATATGISCKDTARKFGFSQCTTEFKELIQNNSLNTVLIATRHNLHARFVLEALSHNKYVYTEKPLCLNETELKEITALYTEKIKSENFIPLILVGFNRRYAPMFMKMKTFFENRKEPMIMHYRVNAGFKDKNDWYQDKETGGGRIIGEACHFIDTFQFLTDALPVTVFAQTIQTDNQMTTLEDNIIITIQFSDGSVGSITYLANGDPQFPKEYMELFCENRVAVMDNFTRLTTMSKGKKKVAKSFVQDKGHKNEMAVFVKAVKNQVMPISFESLYATTMTSFLIHKSINEKKTIPIP
ncbi:MAG: Gfo/Idh/MocA family oxidoreductase [Desulfobacteraceae bacterium]|nr:Gfo/Idh/MocA family oxidoreductase [Desulfobacteraceae bacterium]